jgi:NADH-quinone oxidoreductase subunit J
VTPVLAATPSEQAELIVFIVLAPLAVVTALGMVLSRNAVYSALLLVVNFFCLAGFYVLLEAQFVAAVQVIVYAGAIMVLFLFVLMLLGIGNEVVVKEQMRGQRPAAVLLALGLLVAIVGALLAGVFDAEPTSLAAANEGGNVQAIGRILFTRYTFAFETAGILLVIAAVGALVLGKRQEP